MKIDLSGKYALVGGSSKGIGKAIAERLAASGASVTLMARSEALLKTIIAQLNTSHGQQHQYLVVDFSNFSAFASQMDLILNQTRSIF